MLGAGPGDQLRDEFRRALKVRLSPEDDLFTLKMLSELHWPSAVTLFRARSAQFNSPKSTEAVLLVGVPCIVEARSAALPRSRPEIHDLPSGKKGDHKVVAFRLDGSLNHAVYIGALAHTYRPGDEEAVSIISKEIQDRLPVPSTAKFGDMLRPLYCCRH
jgi:hypothetical protein